jgi:chlorobactene glucosyltransferase
VSWPWWAGALVAAPYWAAPVGMVLGGRPRPSITEWEPLPEDRSPFVSIIVPARNEAANIARCVASILSSKYPRFEVIVVDDRSTDATGNVARAVAPSDSRLKVIAGAELPAGWFGKTWACWQGYEAAKGELLLFTDADTWHGPMLLPRAVAMMTERRVDLVSLLQRQEMRSFWERMIQPLFLAAGGLLIQLLAGGIGRINRNRNPRMAVANGQFILVTRGSYEAVGGHRKIAGSVVEDLKLAITYLKAGRRHFLAFANEDMSTRMYESLGAIVEGWSKNVFMALLEGYDSVAKAYALALLVLTLPLLALSPVPALALGIRSHSAALVAFGAAAYVGETLMVALILWYVREPLGYALLHPLGAAVQVWILVRAMWRGPRRIEWRGRTYVHGVGESSA